MTVVGGGPIGVEMAQAYQRLGSQVTIVASGLLPKEEPDARRRIEQAFEREGLRLVRGRAKSVRRDGDEITIATSDGDVGGDMLLVASGRTPNVDGLDLEKAGVQYSAKGIPVERVNKVAQGRPHIVDKLTDGEVALVFNTTEGWQSLKDSHSIRTTALQRKVPYFTTAAASLAAARSIEALRGHALEVASLQSYYSAS